MYLRFVFSGNRYNSSLMARFQVFTVYCECTEFCTGSQFLIIHVAWHFVLVTESEDFQVSGVVSLSVFAMFGGLFLPQSRRNYCSMGKFQVLAELRNTVWQFVSVE